MMPGIMMIGGLPVCFATSGGGKMAGRFGLLALSRHAVAKRNGSSKRNRDAVRRAPQRRRERGGLAEQDQKSSLSLSLRSLGVLCASAAPCVPPAIFGFL